jgi:glycine dehydrogenase
VDSVNGDVFTTRHIGPNDADVQQMLAAVSGATQAKFSTLDELTGYAIPENIKARSGLAVGPEMGEHEALAQLSAIAGKNKVLKSLIGMGYNACIIPQVILRNVLLNPGWYTPYTPYQVRPPPPTQKRIRVRSTNRARQEDSFS